MSAARKATSAKRVRRPARLELPKKRPVSSTLLSTTQLAELLDIPRITIWSWARDRKIPSVRTLGGRHRPGSYRFTPEHVREIRRALGLPSSASRSSSPAKLPPTGGAA